MSARCPKSRFPIWIIVFDKLELIFFVSQGLTLSTASLVLLIKRCHITRNHCYWIWRQGEIQKQICWGSQCWWNSTVFSARPSISDLGSLSKWLDNVWRDCRSSQETLRYFRPENWNMENLSWSEWGENLPYKLGDTQRNSAYRRIASKKHRTSGWWWESHS